MNKVNRIMILLIVFLASFSIYLIIKIDLKDKYEFDKIINERDFYFEGRIIDQKKIIGDRIIVLIEVDSLMQNNKGLLNLKSKYFHGLINTDKNQIVFYIGSIRGKLGIDKGEFIKVFSAENEILILNQDKENYKQQLLLTKFYGKEVVRYAKEIGWSDWSKF
ncbi:MAG: hypothetical protein ACXITV_05245 [Luteibaculaceae bacterium]